MRRAILLILSMLTIMSVLAACSDFDSENATVYHLDESEDDADKNGADTAENAFLQKIEGEKEHDAEKYLSVIYSVNFDKEKTYEEYVEEFNKKDYSQDELEELKQYDYKITSAEDWDEGARKNAVDQLSYIHKDTDKITKIKNVKYTVITGGEEVNSSNATVVECDGRWYVLE